jgi:hypothetical protein
MVSAPLVAIAQNKVCPQSGIKIEFRSGVRLLNRSFLGESLSDPAWCVYLNDKGNKSGSYYGILSRNIPAEEKEQFGQLISGQISKFSIIMSQHIVTRTGHAGPSEVEKTWRRVGTEQVVIAGRAINALVVDGEVQSRSGHSYQIIQRFWFDLDLRMWVKGQVILSHIIREPESFEVVKFN